MNINTQFKNIIDNNQLYSCEELPSNCRTSHIIKYKNGNKNENVLPIKLYIENESQHWHLKNNLYQGIVILWLTKSNKSLVIHKNEISVFEAISSTILSQYEKLICEFNDIPNKISDYYKTDNLIPLQNILSNTKYKVLSREETKNTMSHPNSLETNAQEELIALLGENSSYFKTPEKCKADAVYYEIDMSKSIGIQVKSATFKDNGILNVFHNTNKYEGLLLFCRAMPRIYVGTFIIPGSSVLLNNLGFSFSERSKYLCYLVPDTLLKSFMSGLYLAVLNNKIRYKYPSGKLINISSLLIKNFDEFCIPEYKTDIKENTSSNWRNQKFPKLSYIVPKVQGTPVDIIINNVKIQDKHAAMHKNRNGYSLKLQKQGGRQNGKNTKIPYEIGDFDGLFVF